MTRPVDEARAALVAAADAGQPSAVLVRLASRFADAQLAEALVGRAVIEQAKGILMGQRHITADEAFELLRSLSQSSNRKIQDVAQAVVEMTHGRPSKP